MIQYLANVSPRTIEWYRQSFAWLNSDPDLDEFKLKAAGFRMREAGLKPSSCNNRIRAWNAYLKWSGSPLRVPRLKEPKLVLPTFSSDGIATFRRKMPFLRRLWSGVEEAESSSLFSSALLSSIKRDRELSHSGPLQHETFLYGLTLGVADCFPAALVRHRRLWFPSSLRDQFSSPRFQ